MYTSTCSSWGRENVSCLESVPLILGVLFREVPLQTPLSPSYSYILLYIKVHLKTDIQWLSTHTHDGLCNQVRQVM